MAPIQLHQLAKPRPPLSVQAGAGANLEVLAPGEVQVPLGGLRLLRVEVLNRGPVAAATAVLRVELTAHLAVRSAVGSGGECTESAGVLACPLGNLPSDASGFVDLMLEGTREGGALATFWVESQTCHPVPAAGVARTAVEVHREPLAGPALTIPSVARLQGVGAFFTSRIELFNAGSTALEAEVVYTPRQDIPGSIVQAAVTVPPGIQQEVDDPLHVWFGFTDAQPAAGTLGFFVPAGRESDLMVQSVVYARNPDGSEYGQFFPALPPDRAVWAGQKAFLSTTVDAVRNRLNLGMVGLEDGTTVQVVPVDPIGAPLAAPRSFTLNAGVSRQINDLNRGSAGFSLGDRSDYVVQLDVQSGAALGFVSVLDGTSQIPGTSDPTTILPIITGSTRQTLIGLGPVMGLNEFTGSASVTNLSNLPSVIRADFYARDDGQSGVAATATVNLGPGETRGFADIVGDLFGLTGVGTVVLTSENDTEFFATGREYAVFRDSQGHVTGTAGQLVPGLGDDELLIPGVTYHLLGLRERTISGALERSNLLIFNPGEEEQMLTIRLVDGATGALEGFRIESIPAGELRQLNRILSTVNPGQDGSPKRLEVTVEGSLFVLASRVNKDGDPVTVFPQAAANEWDSDRCGTEAMDLFRGPGVCWRIEWP